MNEKMNGYSGNENNKNLRYQIVVLKYNIQ